MVLFFYNTIITKCRIELVVTYALSFLEGIRKTTYILNEDRQSPITIYRHDHPNMKLARFSSGFYRFEAWI